MICLITVQWGCVIIAISSHVAKRGLSKLDRSWMLEVD